MTTSENTIPRTHRIHRMVLDEYDDVVSIKDRLQFVEAGRVLLVLPPKATILQRQLDLVLIQREAARLDMRIALITDDFTIIDHAAALQISTFRNASEARRKTWKAPTRKVFVSRAERPQYEHDEFDLMQIAARLRPANHKKQSGIARLLRGGVFGVAILVVLFGMYAALPSATVTVTPARDELNITVPMVADPDIITPVIESFRVPATVERRLQESSVSIQSSGRRPAENSLAEGIVTFTNATSLAQFIPVGTIVQTSSVPPVQYTTQNDAALPARIGATVNVAIRATEPEQGFSGNQPPGAIDVVFGDLNGRISVVNRNATYGEGVREIAFVTENDHSRLLNLARDQVLKDARDAILVSLPEGEFLVVEESMRIVDERNLDYSADIDQPAESVTLRLRATVAATVISLADAELVARGYLSRYIAADRRLDSNSLLFRSGGIQRVLDDGSIAFQMRIEGDTYVAINADEVRDRVTGLNAAEARTVLENEYLLDARYPPEISTWPGITNRLPILPIRIQVDIRTNE
jgi:hypothetical protein